MAETGGTVDAVEWVQIGQVVDRLEQTFPDLPRDTVITVVHRNHACFDRSRLRDFVPLFVERRARRELRQLDPAKIGALV